MSETFANLINSEPQPLARYAEAVPNELQRIVAKMLRKNKDERYQTCRFYPTDAKDERQSLAFDERLCNDSEQNAVCWEYNVRDFRQLDKF